MTELCTSQSDTEFCTKYRILYVGKKVEINCILVTLWFHVPKWLYIKLLKETMHKDMKDAHLPLRFWNYCVERHVHIYNLTSRDVLKTCEISPYIAIMGDVDDISSVSLENHLCFVNFKNYELFTLLPGFSPLGFRFSTQQSPKQVICLLQVCPHSGLLFMGVFLQSSQHDLGNLPNHVA